MTVRDTQALYDWWDREHPPAEVWRLVHGWAFVELEKRGYAYPSIPLGTPTPTPVPPHPSTRIVMVPGTAVVIRYIYEIDTETVDLLDVTGIGRSNVAGH